MKLDVDAFVDASVAIVPDAEVKLVIDDVASDVRPLSTDNVPLDVRDVVAVTEPPVSDEPERVVMYEVILLKIFEKKLDDVPFTLLKLVIVPDATVKLVVEATIAERLEIVVVASADVPVAVRVPATKLDVVAKLAVRLVKNAFAAERSDENHPVDEVALVMLLFVPAMLFAKRFVDVLLVVDA